VVRAFRSFHAARTRNPCRGARADTFGPGPRACGSRSAAHRPRAGRPTGRRRADRECRGARGYGNFGRRIDEPALRRHVRDRDQPCARTDRALKRREVGVPGRAVAGHVAYTSGIWIERGPSAISAAAASSAPKTAIFAGPALNRHIRARRSYFASPRIAGTSIQPAGHGRRSQLGDSGRLPTLARSAILDTNCGVLSPGINIWYTIAVGR
jgi:hypothetical protein